jgi:all-trans-retinol 13,14-reductase
MLKIRLRGVEDHNPQLKASLASQWGEYGLPPSLSPFALHAMIVNYYSHGGY